MKRRSPKKGELVAHRGLGVCRVVSIMRQNKSRIIVVSDVRGREWSFRDWSQFMPVTENTFKDRRSNDLNDRYRNTEHWCCTPSVN